MERSREVAAGLWDKTTGWVDNTWQGSRDFFHAGDQENDFARVWEGVVPKLEDALSLRNRRGDLPEHSWFGDDRESNRRAMQELMDETVAILTVSPSQRFRERIRELEDAIGKDQERIAELRRARITAPHDSLWKTTVSGYSAEIEERRARIAQTEQELSALKSEFASELQRIGLDIGEEQLDFLLSSIVGDDLLDLGIAFDNVKSITLQLEQLLVESQENLGAARRYYGMYMILLKVLAHAQQRLVDEVNGRYLPQIDRIVAKTNGLLRETRALQRRSPRAHPALKANIEAQQLTLRTAEYYRQYLREQSQDVEAAKKRLSEDIAIAENTYETVKVSGELVALMHSGQRLLTGLLNRQVPPLRAFENLEMKREFEKLTQLLQQGASS